MERGGRGGGVKFQSAQSTLSFLVELLSRMINIKYGCYTFFPFTFVGLQRILRPSKGINNSPSA